MSKNARAMLSSDGTDMRVVTSGSGGSDGISIGAFVPGGIDPDTLILRYIATTEFTLPAGLVGSFGDVVGTPVGGSVVFALSKNGTSFGSMTFDDGDNTADFSLASSRDFVPGDIFSVNSPSDTFDMFDLSFTILGE